jgi:integrase
MTITTINRALERMGYKGSLSGHGFRGTASTALHEMGFQSDYIEAQLAHAQRGVRAAYNHASYLDERKTMMEEWARTLVKKGLT